MSWYDLITASCLTLIIVGVVSSLMAATHDLPRINPMDIPYTPCGQQLVETNMVTIGNAKCVQLIYADGSMNHLCDKPPQT